MRTAASPPPGMRPRIRIRASPPPRMIIPSRVTSSERITTRSKCWRTWTRFRKPVRSSSSRGRNRREAPDSRHVSSPSLPDQPVSSQRWSSGLAFSLSAGGAAVGLGSIWRFPYLAGADGGFAFIAVFVLACLVFGAPVLIAEIVIGRWSRRSPPQAAGEIAARFGFSRLWDVVGWTGSVAGFLVVSYYTMIAGWVLAYSWFFLSGNY